MKTKVKYTVEKEINFKFVHVSIPIEYGDEDMPFDFPLRKGDTWEAIIDIDTGEIRDWEKGKSGSFCTKVTDRGTYKLIAVSEESGDTCETSFKIEQDYVPNKLIPGVYGDYVELDIDENGKIKNWPKYPSIEEFLKNENE